MEGQFWQFDGGGEFFFYWSVELLEAEIPELCHELTLLLSTGRSCVYYSDEYGNTLLHVSIHQEIYHRYTSLIDHVKALFVLIGLLGSHFRHFSVQLQNLAELLIDAGVQVHAVSQRLMTGYQSIDLS